MVLHVHVYVMFHWSFYQIGSACCTRMFMYMCLHNRSSLCINVGHKVLLNAVHDVALLVLTHGAEEGVSFQAFCHGLGEREREGKD